MAKCVKCGAETELLVRGVPLCLDCDKTPNAPSGLFMLRKPPARAPANELSRINSELTSAREEYQRAKVLFQRASEMFRDLDPFNPDGNTAFRNARVAQQSAWERYQVALLAFANYRGKSEG